MFSKMPVIAFAAGLVATLCVTDVNAATFWKTCTYSDEACTVLDGDCTEVPMSWEDYDDDYYVELQKALGDHADCESWAAAAVQTDAYKSYSDIEDELIIGSCESTSTMGTMSRVSCSSDGATAAAADPLAEKKKLLNAGIAAAKTAYESAGCGDEETRGRRAEATGTCKVKAGGTNNNCAAQGTQAQCTFASCPFCEDRGEVADAANECIFTADAVVAVSSAGCYDDAACDIEKGAACAVTCATEAGVDAAALTACSVEGKAMATACTVAGEGVGSGEAADVCVALKEALATAESELANLEASSAAAVTASVAVAAATAAAMFL